MKKFYAFLAAALLSVSAFASKDVVPSDAVLADYYDQGQVCVCFFVPAEMVCNDIVLTGSFNGWSDKLENCKACEPLEGYDGWFVVAYDPEEEPDAEKGLQAKPILLDSEGNFNWDYQVGTATKIRGGVEVVQGGYEGQIDLIHYGTDAPNVFTVDTWLNNPCDAVYHNYRFTVISDGCDGLAVPFIVGGFTSWAFEQMQLDAVKSAELNLGVYYFTKKLPEGTGFQIVSGLMDASTGEIAEAPAWEDNSYLQKLIDDVWGRIPGESGDNLLTKEEAEIIFDLRDADLRWARCAEKVEHHYTITAKFPTCGLPAAVEVRGSWAEGMWEKGVEMTPANEAGVYVVEIDAFEGAQYKFCSVEEGWANQILIYNTETDAWEEPKNNEVFKKDDAILVDWQDENHKWKNCSEGIENVVMTESAQKVLVDGVLYIVRDNKMFNAQGAQVR